MLLSFEVLIELDDVTVMRPFQNHHFLLNFADLAVFREIRFVNRLDSYHMLRQKMQREIYFAEGTLAKYLSNAVEFYSSLWYLLCLADCHFYMTGQLSHSFCAW